MGDSSLHLLEILRKKGKGERGGKEGKRDLGIVFILLWEKERREGKKGEEKKRNLGKQLEHDQKLSEKTHFQKGVVD